MRMATKPSTLVARPQKTEDKGEDSQRQREDPAGAEAVGYPAAGGDKYGKRNQIGADADVKRHGLHAEAGRHIGQRGRDHRAVKKLHEKRAGDQQCRRRYAALLCAGAILVH